MKISLNWLGEYIEFTETDPQNISDAVTAHTAEVDEVEVQGSLLEHCCLGKILSLEQHPDADRLQLCEVLTDKGAKRVVCGGTNLRTGMRVAFAHVGATVSSADGELFTLSSVKIRGQLSEGMICAAEELELSDLYPPKPEDGKKPIIDFGDGDTDVGKPLKDVLGLDDVVLHIDNHAITHRADLFSHIGFAVECVAMGIAKWKKMPDFTAPDFPTEKPPFAFRVTAKDVIPRYCSCLLEIDGLGETPDFMKKRLAAVGIRSISLPIDITNYVMMEIGVPMHSFDADDIKGDFVARLAKKDEPLQTLDGKEWKLPEGALVFTDDEGNFDLVGIMGGLRSSTKESTRRVYLHALSIDPVTIRNTVIATGHRTDAATIYEKKVPHIATELGFYRALALFLEHVPGAKIISAPEVHGDNGTAKPIKLSVAKTQSMLGEEIPADTMSNILTDLECTVEASGEDLIVTPPLHRLGDLNGAHDLTEEVGRIYGFNVIENKLPVGSVTPPKRDTRTHMLRDHLVTQGYMELLPLCLVGPDLLRRCKMSTDDVTQLENPIGHETSIMTPSTVPALLEHAEHNMLLTDSLLRTFHVSNVFGPDGAEHSELGAFVAARSKTDIRHDPFLLLKQEVCNALAKAGYEATVDLVNDTPPYAYQGRAASVSVRGTFVGTLCEVHPDVAKTFDLPARAAVLTVNLTEIYANAPADIVFRPISEYPAVSYDTTITMSQDKSVAALLASIRNSSDLLESADVADLFGNPGEDYKLTVRCTYRANDKTLTEEEAKKEFAKAEKLLGV